MKVSSGMPRVQSVGTKHKSDRRACRFARCGKIPYHRGRKGMFDDIAFLK
jgi:ribosomal protein L37E